ncbi:MAG: hypothetical protein WC784_03245 [Candidatus Shapirobacteria bacterium]|jgi:hypothetical protein
MTEFFKSKNRSRLDRKEDEEITKKTIILGAITVLIFVLVIVFGLPLLVKLSVMLGNAKSQSKDNQVKVIPPLAPRLVVSFEATNSANFSIFGVAEPKVNVELLKNDTSLGKETTDDKGGFMFDNITLDKGENVFTALASTDKEGNSELSKAVTVNYDDQPPTLSMVNPSEDAVSVDGADFDVVGKSDKGVSVTINGKLAMVDDNGQFKLKVQLNAGANDLNIVVRNVAGNQVTKTIKVTYDI